jgi:hypothetical protein
MVLDHPGSINHSSAENSLYSSAAGIEKVTATPTSLKLIPYYAWANRGPSAMQVWIPYSYV